METTSNVATLIEKFKNRTEARIVSDGKDPDGYWITWDAKGDADHDEICAKLDTAFYPGFSDSWAPARPSPKQSLGKSIRSLSKKEYNIDNLKNGIWAVSKKHKTDSNSVGIEYDVQLRVECADGELVFNNDEHPLVPVLTSKFESAMAVVPSENIREATQRFFKIYCSSISQRRAGGVEYIPAKVSEAFFMYAEVISEVSETDFTAAEVFHGPRAVAALVKGLIYEANKDIEAAQEAVDKEARSSTLKSRLRDLQSRQHMLQEYTATLAGLNEAASEALEEAMVTVSELSLSVQENI